MNTLSQKDTDFFYATFRILLDFSNRRFHIDDDMDILHADLLEMSFCHEAAHRIWDNPALIDELLSEKDFDEETHNLLESWKHCIPGTFFIERHLKSGSFFIGSNDKVYQVLGLYDPLERLFSQCPQPTIVETTLLPFKDVIIADGIYQLRQIYVGPGLKANLKDIYISAKNDNRIIRQLPYFQQENAAAPIKSKTNLKASKKNTAAKKTGKKPVFLYRLKVYPKGQGRSVYRNIEICGNATLKKLCDTILYAFDFDDDHMYEFCMDNKMYGEDTYQSHPDFFDRSVKTQLNKLNLVPGQKFSLHYDFGDDWMFVIRVESIVETDRKIEPRITKSAGSVEQYPW